jgi:signal transduction histidine kinase
MKSTRRSDDVQTVSRRYLLRMQVRPGLPRSIFDAVIAAVGLALCELAVWGKADTIGAAVAGPTWLRVIFPLLLAVPLAWRRVAPVGAFAVILAGVLLQALVTGNTPEGIELIYTLGIGVYAAAAHSARRHAVLALVLAVAVYGVYMAENHDVQTGKAGELWAASFFGVALVAVWLVGAFVRYRHDEREAISHAANLEEQARTAVADERIRLARELHDVVSHNLSVVVLQAAGARASGAADPSTLAKIEQSGRESLVEMRRLLGVLRRDGDGADLAPQHGVASLAELAERVRAAGVPVELRVDDGCRQLAPALDASIYRIVQESLTNVIKHAGAAQAVVEVHSDPQAVTVVVVNDGDPSARGENGHGLIGMRERVALFGGELSAAPLPGGGFAVHARLLRDGGGAR